MSAPRLLRLKRSDCRLEFNHRLSLRPPALELRLEFRDHRRITKDNQIVLPVGLLGDRLNSGERHQGRQRSGCEMAQHAPPARLPWDARCPNRSRFGFHEVSEIRTH